MIPPGRLTLEEFLKLPEQKPRLEFLDGQVTQRPVQGAWSGALQMEFMQLVNRYAEPRKLAIAFPGVRATFGGASLVPPVGVYLWENIPRRADGRIADDALTPWDIVLEFDVDQDGIYEKCKWYRANGVKIVLLADADTEDVASFGADGSSQTFVDDFPINLETVLPGFKFTAWELFSALYPDGRSNSSHESSTSGTLGA
jgi:Uma2 family endonuclease